MQLHVEHVFVALPRFVKHEVVLGVRIAVQVSFMKHRLAAHGVEHAVQKLEKAIALKGRNVKFDHVRDSHGEISELRSRESEEWSLEHRPCSINYLERNHSLAMSELGILRRA